MTVSLTRNGPRFDLVSEVAAAMIARWEDSGGTGRPPVPIERLVEAEGFRVVRLYGIPDAVSGLVIVRDRLIGINGRHHVHRQRFTLGHELGHILMGHPPENRCDSARIALFNREADRCASELLMPERMVRPCLRECRDPADLARIFAVSPEAILLRLQQLAVCAWQRASC